MKPRYFAAAVAVCALTAAGAWAQTAAPVDISPANTAAAPVPGANSFTKGEARSRIEKRGFASVADLQKDGQGIWRGTATKDGRPVKVALDFKGNIFAK